VEAANIVASRQGLFITRQPRPWASADETGPRGGFRWFVDVRRGLTFGSYSLYLRLLLRVPLIGGLGSRCVGCMSVGASADRGRDDTNIPSTCAPQSYFKGRVEMGLGLVGQGCYLQEVLLFPRSCS
jgi:hypothetical protein